MATRSETGSPVVAVGRDDVERAAAAGVIEADQADALWQFLSAKAAASDSTVRPRFDLVHLLWYAGALIVIGAMGLFATLAFARAWAAALLPPLPWSTPCSLRQRAIACGGAGS